MSIEATVRDRMCNLDWLRVLVVLMLVPFHAAVIFDGGSDFYIMNPLTSNVLPRFTGYVGTWGMQLLFFVAGAASYFALRKFGWKRFLRERTLRLLVPFGVSAFTLLPIMGYVGAQHHSRHFQSFWDYYPHFFQFSATDVTGSAGHFTPGHLWFTIALLVLTVVLLPLLQWALAVRGQRFVGAVAAWLSRPGMLLAIPLVLFLFDGVPEFAGRNFVSFLLLFLLGFVFMTSEALQDVVTRQKYLWLLLSLGAGLLYMAIIGWGERQVGPSWGATSFDVLRELFLWSTILALFGMSRAYLSRPSTALGYLRKASYSFYIIHLPIVVLIGAYAIRWDVGLWVKWATITVLAYTVTVGAYEGVIRRARDVRRLFNGVH